ncbi:uncharacterized protein [Magallana gigas]|uniref:uncharacterized protein n=1 Tax=Magallana gigas TaxID=29159 RepID=UPI00333EA8CD
MDYTIHSAIYEDISSDEESFEEDLFLNKNNAEEFVSECEETSNIPTKEIPTPESPTLEIPTFESPTPEIPTSEKKLEKKKRHSLIKKYKDDLCFASSAELSSDTSIPSGDSNSLVSEESMTVQSSVASMDATVPCKRTAEETSGMVCSATVSTETSSSIRGATLSEEMTPTIWATPEIDSTERTSSPAIPVESTLCEITFGSSAERSSDTFIPSGDSTSLVSEESMTVQSSVASMKKMGVMSKDATVPHSSTVQKTPEIISSTTVSTETSSSILGATLSEEMSPTIWTTPEIDSTETRSNSTIPIKSTSCEITFGSSEELSFDTFIPSGDSNSLVSEESMTVQSSVASMDATVPCTSTAEETSGMMCSATVSTKTSSSICGATFSKEMSPTIWATPEIDSTERTSSPAIPVESTLCEITFGSSAERSSDTFIPSGDSTSLVSEEKTSSSIRGATLSEEMSPTIWTTPEIDSTERTSSPAIPVESTSCEITIGSSAERSSDTFIPSGACTTSTMSELSAYLTSVIFSATFEADLPASDDQSVNPIRETWYRQCTSLKPKGQKLLLADMNFSDDEEEFGETDSDRESVYIPDFDCESVDDDSDVSSGIYGALQHTL